MPRQHVAALKKWSLITIGGLLVVLGFVTFWLPLPIGLPLLLLGAPLLLRHSPHARRWWVMLRKRWPRAKDKVS